MRLRRIAAALCVVLLMCLGLVLWYRHKMLNRVLGLQGYMIMVDGIRYRSFGPIPTDEPEGIPDGMVHRVNDPADYPDEDGEANFGSVGMPYWKVPLGICVYKNDDYILLRD